MACLIALSTREVVVSNLSAIVITGITITDDFEKEEVVLPDEEKNLTSEANLAYGKTATVSNYKEGSTNYSVITDGVCSVSDEIKQAFSEFKKKTGTKLTGILLDYGQSLEFSLKEFADKVYHTSELSKDTIAEKMIKENI